MKSYAWISNIFYTRISLDFKLFVSHTERERERVPICWFTLQKPAVARGGLSSKPGAGSAVQVSHLEPSLLLPGICISRKLVESGARARV